MNAKPISESSKSSPGQIGCVIAFGLIFFLAGMFMLIALLAIPWLSSRGSADWQKVPCTIVSSKVKRHVGDDSESFSVEIKYDYQFDQQNFTSDQYDFNAVSPGRKACKEIVGLYPAGRQAICFVDPDDPQNAVLNRDFRMSWMMLLLGSIFSAVGATVSISLPISMAGRKKKKSTVGAKRGSQGRESPRFGGSKDAVLVNNLQSGEAYSAGTYPEDLDDQKWDVAQRLKPATTKIGQLMGLLAIALFWNGVVGTLVFTVLQEFRVGLFSIFMMLFLVPFVLIGLLIIFGVVKSFLSLFNPVFEIAMSTGAIGRGNSVDVAWEIKGNAHRIDRLRIAAVGTETARYKQGTDVVTTTSDFGVIEIADTKDTEQISFGSHSVTIPVDAMHTFVDRNNQITWAIHVKADIQRFPDVFQKHIFRVKP